MKESIYIKNFGGIDEMTLEINDITILIGPQASGKSVTAKLVYFFKSMFEEILLVKPNYQQVLSFEVQQKIRFESYFPAFYWPKGEFLIKYQFGDLIFQAVKKLGGLSLKINDIDAVYSFRINQIRSEKETNPMWLELVNFWAQVNSNHKVRFGKQVYIPAERSYFNLINHDIYSLIELKVELDELLLKFGQQFNNSRKSFVKLQQNLPLFSTVFNKTSKVLKGEIVVENHKFYIKHNDGRRISLAHSSTGQQASFSLFSILSEFLFVRFEDTGTTIYVEEPESHLFPSAQKVIVEFLTLLINSLNDVQLFITTHSPYILTSFSNLIQAGKIERDKPELKDELYKIVPKEEIIKPGTLTCYSLDNGTGVSIMDQESELIKGNMIDDASEIIGQEFDKLLDLEFGTPV